MKTAGTKPNITRESQAMRPVGTRHTGQARQKEGAKKLKSKAGRQEEAGQPHRGKAKGETPGRRAQGSSRIGGVWPSRCSGWPNEEPF